MAPANLQTELKKPIPFESPHQEALLNLMRTYGLLIAPLTRLLKQYGMTDAHSGLTTPAG